VPSLVAYGVAKALAKTNAALRTVIAPLAEIFATRRARADKSGTQGPTEGGEGDKSAK
jgi:hypothetical protein